MRSVLCIFFAAVTNRITPIRLRETLAKKCLRESQSEPIPFSWEMARTAADLGTFASLPQKCDTPFDSAQANFHDIMHSLHRRVSHSTVFQFCRVTISSICFCVLAIAGIVRGATVDADI